MNEDKRSKEEIIKILKAKRKELKLNQQDVAKELGWGSASRISEIESGKTKNIEEYVNKFCEKYNIDEKEIKYKDQHQEKIIKTINYAYKTPSYKLSIIMSIILLISCTGQFITFFIKNELSMNINLLISVLTIIICFILFLIQFFSSENIKIECINDGEKFLFKDDKSNEKHPKILFLCEEMLTLFLLIMCTIFFTTLIVDVSIIIIALIILIFEGFVLFFGFNIVKKKSDKNGFILYIFETLSLLFNSFNCMLMSYGIHSIDFSFLSIVSASFNFLTMIYLILRMLVCSKMLNDRKIISE